MIIYGPKNECVSIFEPVMTVMINLALIMASLFMVIYGYMTTIIPILMFVFSIVLTHLSDTATKILIVTTQDRLTMVSVSYYTTLLSFLIWYIGSYILLLYVVSHYAIFVLFFGCVVTFVYATILVFYFILLANLRMDNYIYYNSNYRY